MAENPLAYADPTWQGNPLSARPVWAAGNPVGTEYAGASMGMPSVGGFDPIVAMTPQGPMLQSHLDAAHAQVIQAMQTAPTLALGMIGEAPGRATTGPLNPIDHMLEQIKADPKAKWGLRVVLDPIEGGPGTVLPPSRVWDDGKPTDKLLGGTSAIGINGTSQKHLEAALTQAGILPWGEARVGGGYYPGEHVALVKGSSAKRGYDDMERIIPRARVVSVYRKANDGRAELLPMDSDGTTTQQ